MKRLIKLLVLSLVATGVAAGCNEKTNPASARSKPQPVKRLSVILVPDSVKGKWKAVKISVTDKNTSRQRVYTIAIGSDFKLPDSDITLKVENFLPHFVMEGTTLTSQSNELSNPATQISIREGEQVIFKGWLFSLYPTTHTFQHPQYGFTLVDSIPAS